MVIYRLESLETRIGVYSFDPAGEVIDRWLESKGLPWASSKHPAPCNDSKLWALISNIRLDDYVFGFDSLKQFRAWFYSDDLLTQLERAGIVLRAYSTAFYFVGNSQAVFLKSDHTEANIIEEISLKTLLTK